MREVVLASANPGKLAEFRALLADSGMRLTPQSEFGAGEVVEDGATFFENALIKARHAAGVSGLTALADDSGLVVDALGGAPGIHSARYAGAAGDARSNMRKLLQALDDVPDAGRRAHFYCVLVLMRRHDDPAPIVCDGRWYGTIARAPRGEGGFGYDPLFIEPESGRTAAEIGPARKNMISHRARAAARLVESLAGL